MVFFGSNPRRALPARTAFTHSFLSRCRRPPAAPPRRRTPLRFVAAALALAGAAGAASSPRIIDDDDNHWNSQIGLAGGGVIAAAEAQLFRVYYGALGRLPDAGGFAWWANEIAEGRRDLHSMAAGFIRSPEFRSLADRNGDGSVSHGEFMLHMYLTVFGREPDPAGFAWWKAELDSGRRTTTDVLIGMTQSNEYVALTLPAAADYLAPQAQLRVADGDYWRAAVSTVRRDAYRSGRPDTATMYARVPDPLNCDPGELSAWARHDALESLNALRRLHGLSPVSYLDHFDSEVQSAALVQLANEDFFGHFPTPSLRCYSQLAYDGARSSNLSFATADRAPTLEIFGWADDAKNVGNVMAVGHRRHVIKPDLGYLAYGATLGMAAQKVFDFGLAPGADDFSGAFVAFPQGAYPYVLLSQDPSRPTPWSFHMAVAEAGYPEHDYFRDATVRVVDVASGAALPVENVYRDSSRGYGRLHGALSWLVRDYAYDRSYEVQVDGVSLPTGERRNYRYPVLIARYDILDLAEPLEASDSPLPRGLQGRIDAPDDRDAVTVQLDAPGSLRVVGDSRYLNWAFVVELYDARKNLILATDEEQSLALEAGRYTLAVGRCARDGLCYSWDTLDYRVELQP